MRTRRWSLGLVASVIGLGFLALSVRSARAANAGQAAYLEGLDALEAQHWVDASKGFSLAIEADDENADYYLARGVASLIAGDMKQAGTDLDRSYKLDRKNETTQRWYAAYFRMNDQAQLAARVRSPADYRGTIQEAAEQYHQLKYDQKSPADAQALRRRFEGFGVSFARDVKTARPDLAGSLLDRMNASVAAGRYDDALKDLAPLMQASPLDFNLLFTHALCLRHTGHFYTARRELTRVLSEMPLHAPAYLERAIVEAKLGNLKMARADLAAAARLGQPEESTRAVEREIAAAGDDPAGDSPEARWAALVKAADASQPLDRLAPLAVALERAMNAHRQRWDEIYQERRRDLESAVKESPNDVARLLALGEFLYREADPLGEQLCPGGPYATYRFSGNNQTERELTRADEILDKALAIDPGNVPAMTWKAAIRLEYGNWDEGAAWVGKALAVRDDVPDLLELLTRVLDRAASAKAYQAQDLRTPKFWTTSDIQYIYHWTHYPSAAERAAADELDRQANELWDRAEKSLVVAVKSRAGTADGFYFDGLLKWRQSDNNTAVIDFENAVKMDPSRRNRTALAKAYAKAGRADDALREKIAFTLTRQTTATCYLAAAWTHMQDTAYRKSRASLDAALSVDPCDTRTPAYLAALATAQAKPEEALKWYNVALALEQAHHLLDGRSLLAGDAALDAQSVGMWMMLNLRAAFRCGDLNRPDDESACLQRNLALQPRLVQGAFTMTSPIAVLPNPNDPKATTPRTVQNLMAWSKVLAGYRLLAKGQIDDARGQFDEVWKWQHLPELFEVQQLACAGVTRLTWAKQDPDASVRQQWLSAATKQRGLSVEECQRVERALMAGYSPYRDPRGLQRIQGETLPLYQYRDQPAVPGGYDPKANPNYKGTDDRGLDDAPTGPAGVLENPREHPPVNNGTRR